MPQTVGLIRVLRKELVTLSLVGLGHLPYRLLMLRFRDGGLGRSCGFWLYFCLDVVREAGLQLHDASGRFLNGRSLSTSQLGEEVVDTPGDVLGQCVGHQGRVGPTKALAHWAFSRWVTRAQFGSSLGSEEEGVSFRWSGVQRCSEWMFRSGAIQRSRWTWVRCHA